eukprot:5730874-Pyramimonas_sp.AAC.1
MPHGRPLDAAQYRRRLATAQSKAMDQRRLPIKPRLVGSLSEVQRRREAHGKAHRPNQFAFFRGAALRQRLPCQGSAQRRPAKMASDITV